MAVDTTSPRSRRAILMGALGGLGLSVASALGRTNPVRATDGDAVLVGHTYSATTTTEIDATGGVIAFTARADSSFGIYGHSSSNTGVAGNSYSGIGTSGYSSTSIGVYGDNSAPDQPAILGQASGISTGVQGYSGYNSSPAPPSKTGVFGYSDLDSSSRGVQGQSPAGCGVFGLAGNGIGTRGYSSTGAAGYFSTSGPKSGTALRAIGKVRLDNCAGIATVAAGHNSVTVTPGTDLLSTSAVVATLQGHPGGTTMVRSVAVNSIADTFTVYLTANTTAAVTVAWHVFG